MDMNKVKLIFSKKYNQFYKPIRVDEDVGTFYMQVTKNRHKKGMTKEEIIHIEKNPNYKYVVMHDDLITAEQHFINVMDSKCNTQVKICELRSLKKNMLLDSECAMQKLKEVANRETIDSTEKNSKELNKMRDIARMLYRKFYHKQILIDNRSTYINQSIPSDIKNLALSKRLFIERSDDYCGKPKHLSTEKDRHMLQGLYPCGFLIRDKGGIVVAGGRYELSIEEVIQFVEQYVLKEEKHYGRLYYVPMEKTRRKQLTMCQKILEKNELHYKNEHNCFFWVLDNDKNILLGGKNGIGFKGLLNYCRKLKYGQIEI